ncbi:VanZ family protein [Rheinheimera sp.]|uniref:VanZ family protein n=1 Tax=Rheinheimera sp. TaxID=1869214 RepID=UPI0027362963|nr:VanZ family protein [Rheinheimera sp.]MDP2715751.1 VanZ family protein [Rheinheimera sp.]
MRVLEFIAVCVVALLLGIIFAKYFYHQAAWLVTFEHFLGGDAMLHFFVGFLLTFSLAVFLRLQRLLVRWQLVYFVTVALLYGADEFLQIWVPHRIVSWHDLIYSMLGWLTALILWFVVTGLRRHVIKSKLSNAT